jgi:hypothetical protein
MNLSLPLSLLEALQITTDIMFFDVPNQIGQFLISTPTGPPPSRISPKLGAANLPQHLHSLPKESSLSNPPPVSEKQNTYLVAVTGKKKRLKEV